MNITALWRNLTIFWTVIFFAAIIYDFITQNSLESANILLPIAVISDAFLALYSGEKEFKRWHDHHTSRHPGEFFVILWTILVFGLLGFGVIFNRGYHVPAEVSSSYIVVIGILAITNESKHFYRKAKYDESETELL